MGFPSGSDSKESACNAGDLGFDPWIGKLPWRRAWQPTPVFLLGEPPWTEEPGGLQSMGSHRVGRDWATQHWGEVYRRICISYMQVGVRAHMLQSLSPVSLFWPHGLWPARLLCQWNFPGKKIAAPEDLSNPGIETTSLWSPALAGRFLTAAPPGKPPENKLSLYKGEREGELIRSLGLADTHYNLWNNKDLLYSVGS